MQVEVRGNLRSCYGNRVSLSSHVSMAPEGSALKEAQLGYGIKTCRSHTTACARAQEPAMGWPEPVPPLVGTGSHPAPDKLESQECCSHFDCHLTGREAVSSVSSSSRDKSPVTNVRDRPYRQLMELLSEVKAVMGNDSTEKPQQVGVGMKSKMTRQNDLTTSVCHAVEEEPGVRVGAELDEGHIMAGLNAEHSKQLHHLPGHRGRGGCLC